MRMKRKFVVHIRGRQCTVTLAMVTVRSTIKRAIKLKRRNGKGAEEPTHPRSLIIAFIFRYLESKSFKLAIRKILDSS